jgi:hypothetical protein
MRREREPDERWAAQKAATRRSADPAAARAGASPVRAGTGVPDVLALQRSAGNLVVSALLRPVVARYESGEHAQMAGGSRAVKIHGQTVTEGELAAMGDLYETPDEMYAADPAEFKALLDLIRRDKAAFEGVAGAKKVSNAEWEAATKGRPANKRYLELARRNDPHFAPSTTPGSQIGNYKSEWEKWHAQALGLAVEAAATGAKAPPERAVAANGFASHFLTDAFSAGHLFSKTEANFMARNEWGKQKTTGMIFKETAFTKAVAKGVLGDPGAGAKLATKELKLIDWGPVSEQRFSELIWQMADSAPDDFFNAFGRLVHDKLNTDILTKSGGIQVENDNGDKWPLSGDETLASSPKTKEIARKAVEQSYANLDKAMADAAGRGGSPTSLDPYFKAVWAFVPRASKGAGDAQLKAIVDTFTDPSKPETLKAFIELTVAQIDTAIEALTTRGNMRDKPAPKTAPAPTAPVPTGAKY